MIIHVKNLDDIKLLNNKIKDKHVTVIFYFMEGCFHCDNMKPAWHKFEKMYENDENNTIAMVESNHIQHLEDKPYIVGFPTIYKYGNNHPIEYSGDRSTKSFVKFAGIKTPKKTSKKKTKKSTKKSTKKPIKKSTKKPTKKSTKKTNSKSKLTSTSKKGKSKSK